MGFRFRSFNPFFRSCLHRDVLRPSSASLLVRPSSAHLLPHLPHPKVPIRWHLGHSHSDSHHLNTPDASGAGEEGEKIFRLGFAADIGLSIGKAFTGYLTGSTAIIADAAHSISDVVLSGIALWSFKAGMAPKDREHPYGHGKFESLGALGISSILLVTAGGIAWHAVDVLLVRIEGLHNHAHGGHHHGIDLEHPILAFSMVSVSISVKEGLYWITKRAGDKLGSGLMKANAWHHRADAISSVVALIGVGGSLLGVKFLDPVAGLFVSGMILKAGLQTGYQSVLELVDAAIPVVHLDHMRQTILRVSGVSGCHRLRGRRAGSYLFLDVHIEVDPFCSVSAAHGIGENVRKEIHLSHPEIAEVYIHIDPAFLELPHDNMSQNQSSYIEDTDIETIVNNIFMTKFQEKMKAERVTRHMINGKTLLEIEVDMPDNISVKDAKKVAKEADKEILKEACNVIQVSIQLNLGTPIPKFKS
ncbi:Metal tolerance protein C1 [Linum perenne]